MLAIILLLTSRVLAIGCTIGAQIAGDKGMKVLAFLLTMTAVIGLILTAIMTLGLPLK